MTLKDLLENPPDIKRPKNITDAQWDRALRLYEAARNVGDKFPAITVAQAALETGWFKKESGKNNLFGQKAAKGQRGSIKTTHETINGVSKKIDDRFRDYESIEESLVDRKKKWMSKYQNASNPREAINSIWRYDKKRKSGVGYATDSNYGWKIENILGQMGQDVHETPYERYETVHEGRDTRDNYSVAVDNTFAMLPNKGNPTYADSSAKEAAKKPLTEEDVISIFEKYKQEQEQAKAKKPGFELAPEAKKEHQQAPQQDSPQNYQYVDAGVGMLGEGDYQYIDPNQKFAEGGKMSPQNCGGAGQPPCDDEDYIEKIRASRGGYTRDNKNGTHSTHLMADNGIDTAFPTLFRNPDGSWDDLSEDHDKAFERAKKEKEVYKFKNKRDLFSFARRGDWKEPERTWKGKKKNIPDLIVDSEEDYRYLAYKDSLNGHNIAKKYSPKLEEIRKKYIEKGASETRDPAYTTGWLSDHGFSSVAEADTHADSFDDEISKLEGDLMAEVDRESSTNYFRGTSDFRPEKPEDLLFFHHRPIKVKDKLAFSNRVLASSPENFQFPKPNQRVLVGEKRESSPEVPPRQRREVKGISTIKAKGITMADFQQETPELMPSPFQEDSWNVTSRSQSFQDRGTENYSQSKTNTFRNKAELEEYLAREKKLKHKTSVKTNYKRAANFADGGQIDISQFMHGNYNQQSSYQLGEEKCSECEEKEKLARLADGGMMVDPTGPPTKKVLSREEYIQNLTTSMDNNYLMSPEGMGGVTKHFTNKAIDTRENGYNCINGVCQMITGATGLKFNNGRGRDGAYVGNQYFNGRLAEENFYNVKLTNKNYNLEMGDIVQAAKFRGEAMRVDQTKAMSQTDPNYYTQVPQHAYVVTKVVRDEDGNPVSYEFSENGGKTKIMKKKITAEQFKTRMKKGWSSNPLNHYSGYLVNRYDPSHTEKQEEKEKKKIAKRIEYGKDFQGQKNPIVPKDRAGLVKAYPSLKPVFDTLDTEYTALGETSGVPKNIFDAMIKYQIGIAGQETRFSDDVGLNLNIENETVLGVGRWARSFKTGAVDGWMKDYYNRNAGGVKDKFDTFHEFKYSMKKEDIEEEVPLENEHAKAKREEIVAPKSIGMFQQKKVSEQGGLWGVTKDDIVNNDYAAQFKASLGLMIDNYKVLKNKYPDKKDEDLAYLAVGSHSAPGKILTKEYADYYGVDRDNEGKNIDYVEKVKALSDAALNNENVMGSIQTARRKADIYLSDEQKIESLNTPAKKWEDLSLDPTVIDEDRDLKKELSNKIHKQSVPVTESKYFRDIDKKKITQNK